MLLQAGEQQGFDGTGEPVPFLYETLIQAGEKARLLGHG
jgi:hypothetical protein